MYKLPLKTELIESAKLSAISQSIPTLSASAEEAKRLLSNQMVIEETPMSPTKLGILIAQQRHLSVAPSAKLINQILTEKGLQVAEYSLNRQGKKRLQYRLTPLGENYGQMQLEQASNGAKTLVIVRWFSQVIKVIGDRF